MLADIPFSNIIDLIRYYRRYPISESVQTTLRECVSGPYATALTEYFGAQ